MITGLSPEHELWDDAVRHISIRVTELAECWKPTLGNIPPAGLLLLLWYDADSTINSGYYNVNGAWEDTYGREVPDPDQWLLIEQNIG